MAGQQRQDRLQGGRSESAKASVITTRITEKALTEDLQDVAAEWMSLGTQLKIPRGILHAIKGEKSRVANCFEAILEEWLLGDKTPHSKEELLRVLRTNTLRENTLARSIEDNPDVPLDFNIDDHLSLLTNELSGIAAHYSDFGVQLGISNDTIKQIEQRVYDVKRYLQEMLADWLKQGKPLTDVLVALRGPAIRNPNLAGKLERKWRQDGFLPAPQDGTDGPAPDIN